MGIVVDIPRSQAGPEDVEVAAREASDVTVDCGLQKYNRWRRVSVVFGLERMEVKRKGVAVGIG